VHATTATVIFGEHVRPIVHPGASPALVTEFHATDMYEAADEALDALDGALGLSRPGAARLLVIVSDGLWQEEPRRTAQAHVDRLRRSGCGLLWLAPKETEPVWAAQHLDGAKVLELGNPAATATSIARAATTVLRTTHPG
jgi:hypothetical protein